MKTIEQIYNDFIENRVYEMVEVNFYIQSYPYYINFFATKDVLTKEDIVLGLGLVYSWMPTIPKNIKFDLLDDVLPILTHAKSGVNLDKEEYFTMKCLCNNSLVGASKLLHFINPKQFAIWDSKIYSYLYEDKTPHKYKIEDIDKYMAYLDLLNQIAHSTKFRPIIQEIQVVFHDTISKYRAIEWMFFNL